MGSLVLTCLAVWLFRRSYARDRRQLRNGFYLACVVWFAIATGAEFATYAGWPIEIVLLLLIALLPLCVLVLAGFLVANGVTMVRKEGRGLGNLLSLFAGLALFTVPAVAVALVLTASPIGVGIAGLLFVVTAYLGVFFVVFLGYALFYSRSVRVKNPAAIVVLGSGLINGEVPPLLRSRIDRAIEVWRRHPHSLLIPSGGQGADEPRPEAAAMAEYMLASGVPAAAVLPEARSTTTRENLTFSQLVIDTHGAHAHELGSPPVESGARPVDHGTPPVDHGTPPVDQGSRPVDHGGTNGSGEVLAVTSNYHVLRAALTASDVGSPAQVIGAPTAWYFVPSAFLREFVAVLARHRGLHVLLLTPFVVLAAACVTLLLIVG